MRDRRNREPEERRRRKSLLIRVGIVLGMVVIGILMIVSVSVSIRISMKENQRKTLDTVAVRTTVNMQRRFQRQWEYLECAEKNLCAHKYETSEQIFRVLEQEKDALGFTGSNNLLFLVDNDGFYHSIYKGKVALWHSANTIFASSSLQAEREISVNALKEMNPELDEYLCFTKKLEEDLTAADGSRFTHIILAADKSIFDIDRSLADFGEITDTLVIDSKGRKINSQMSETSLANSYNVLQALQGAEFLMGNTYEELKEALSNEGDGSTLISYEGVNYYITYNYMGLEDWFSVLLVREYDMKSDIQEVAYRLITLLSSGFVIMILMVTALLLYSAQQMLRVEKKARNQLVEAADVAEKANLAKSVFLSRMSHDIRTPINGIIGMTKIAEATIDDQKSVKNCLKKIGSSSEHLAELVNEVLEISRIESGKTEVKPAKMNLLHMIDVLNDIIESRLLDKSLDYKVDYTGLEHPYIMGDMNLLKQMMLNLLGNSVKYTPDGGHVKYTIYDEPAEMEDMARYHFIIEDTGIGMSREFLSHIFERFSQESDNVRTNYEGTGLGMAITKEFVDLMGGTITVESEVGKGSKFEVILTFPVRKPDNAEQEEETQQGLEEADSYHVLVAEDNEINRTIVEFILSEHGSSCVSVSNGQALVERFAESEMGEFDAIMTDIRMPVMDGLTATKTIRAMEREDAKTIPIFAMTANAYQEDRERSLAAGMNAHLTKPIEAKLVIEALRKYCK